MEKPKEVGTEPRTSTSRLLSLFRLREATEKAVQPEWEPQDTTAQQRQEEVSPSLLRLAEQPRRHLEGAQALC